MPALGSHTYSRLNQTTNSSSQSHTSWRRSGSWQVAGSSAFTVVCGRQQAGPSGQEVRCADKVLNLRAHSMR